MQAVEHSEYRLFQCCSANNTVVNDHEGVSIVANAAVCYIVDMGGEFVTLSTFGYKCPKFYVFERDFLDS